MRDGEVETIYEVAQLVKQFARPIPLQELKWRLEQKIKCYQTELAWAQRNLEEVQKEIEEEKANASQQAADTEEVASGTYAAK